MGTGPHQWRCTALLLLALCICLYVFMGTSFLPNSVTLANPFHFIIISSHQTAPPPPPPPPPDYKNASSWDGLSPPPHIPLPQLFSTLTPSLFPSSFPPLTLANYQHLTNSSSPFTSSFLPNPNQYVSLAMRHACIEPLYDGRLLLVGVTADDIVRNVSGKSAIANLAYLWDHKYWPCGNKSTEDCAGVRFTPHLPANARWVPGNTMHLIAYSKGNTFHNFAERVWPRLAVSVPPLNDTTQGLPVHQFFVHRLDQLLEEASTRKDRDQVLWQFRMLMEIWKGSSLLRLQEEGDRDVTLCFNTLLLQMHDKDRIDRTRLPPSTYIPALLKYRDAIFKFLNLTAPIVPHPPHPLRLLYYGRSDSSRRRVMNNKEMLDFLQNNITRINFEIRSLDLLLQTSQTDYSFTHLVSLFSQTDILIIAHGAFTWGTLFMPMGGIVVEIFGPCDFMKRRGNYSDLTNIRSWIWSITNAVGIKHDISNPFQDPVPNLRRGNTTHCLEPFNGVPDYTINPKKVSEIIHSWLDLQQHVNTPTLH